MDPAPDHATIAGLAAREGLLVMGGVQEGDSTLILLGPARDFWQVFRAAPEYRDGRPDPIDRWSERVIGALAAKLDARPLFPFGGPPYQPFLKWALASGRAWSSPVGMLVHDTAGLMVSYRGALRFARHIALPPVPDAPPCAGCADQPCLTACPVDALSAGRGYDTAACHAFLDSGAGADCMMQGCAARRACPVSRAFGRDPEQSALHMRSFHPGGGGSA